MSNILHLFEATADRFPDKTAIAYKDASYTFSELRTAAKQMGAAIRNRYGLGKPVAVIVERDADTAVLFLSVVYSGNYYIPLDPEMPAAKLCAILADSGASLIVGNETARHLIEQLGVKADFLTLNDRTDDTCTYTDVPDDTPLYMVYTSGSTGKPKGVLKSHGSVIDFIRAFADTFGLDHTEVIGNQNPFFFDASAKDLYLMLYTGATLEVIPSEKFIFPVTLIEYMNERKISYICWVPTALALVTQMNTFRKVTPAYLKKVLFVGEVFPMKQLRKWVETLPDLEYVNLYGSSEIAGIACYYRIQELPDSLERLPMGKALPNCRVFLSSDGNVIENAHETGEVCIASDALALCYFHDPQKTADVFTTMELANGKTARVLKTGDLAQYDANGDLVFVSRKDFQIKHMGRRIELGEIETAADTIADIQRCCCLYNDRKKRIELFCEQTEDSEMTAKDIQSLLKTKLSDYMVPSKVHLLDAMPFNANGKIDRTKLKESM